MTGTEYAIEQAALAIHADHCCPCDSTGCDAPDGVDYNAARAVAEAGLLAPAPLREEWGTRFNEDGGRIVAGKDSPYPFFWDGKDPEGENVRRYITGWLSADGINRAEGDGKAVCHE